MLFLVNALISSRDLRTRCSIRSQLEASGVPQIHAQIRAWKEPVLDGHLIAYAKEAEKDRRELVASQQATLLNTMRAPEDVFRSLLQTTRGSKSSGYLLNTLRHMLLIHNDQERYFQLIDRLIVSIVMNDSPDMGQDFARAFGISVTHLIGKFVEQDRIESAMDEIKGLKSALNRSELENADLTEKLEGGSDQLVRELRARISELEEKLQKSRAATDALRDQMDGMKRDYESRINDLELVIQELFNMLREANHLDTISHMNQGPINREQLIHDLREQWHRKKTIQKLEGGSGGGGGGGGSGSGSGSGTDTGFGNGRESALQDGSGDRNGGGGYPYSRNGSDSRDEEIGQVIQAEKGKTVPAMTITRDSNQFQDATEDDVRAHIEEALIRGADHIVSVVRESN